MNDEKMDSVNQNTQNAGECNPISEDDDLDAGKTDGFDLAISDEGTSPQAFSNDTENPAEDSEIFAHPVQDPDSDSSSAIESDSQIGLEQLRSELTQLRQELASREAFWKRIGDEYTEFQTLFPQTELASLSDATWEDVKRGVPLAAAYALAEKRRLFLEEKASKSNFENQKKAFGALSGSENEYFSSQEVRAMSQEEVRANYHKIMKSMQKWH